MLGLMILPERGNIGCPLCFPELDEDRHFPAGDETELAKRLEYWIKKGPLSDEEQEKQLAMLRKRYDWDKIAEETLKVYEAVNG